MNREMLTPVSFHLRNFNSYQNLDISASKKGNMTLIGENMMGKTTLANCFFPMLIDGSIATPSFNPAKETKNLDKTTTRNSANDSRTFESMLLGWDVGAMKVRTGYSYMLMRSQSRQVIVGIGAHRALGETRKPTWWFVAISEDIKGKLRIETTDDKGDSLEKDEFIAKNSEINAEFKVFSKVEEFQNYVSKVVYGFSDTRSLNRLANTYRLLASPILTAGNASLTPILEAMKNAQESIDTQLIDSVANAQREVNKKRYTFEQLTRAERRLNRLKTEIFWSNLNHLQDLTIEPYSNDHQKMVNLEEKKNVKDKEFKGYTEGLSKTQSLLTEYEGMVQNLQEQWVKQRNIESQRYDKIQRIKSLQKNLARYEVLEEQLNEKKSELDDSQRDMKQLQASKEKIEQTIAPLKSGMITLSLEMNDLKKLIQEKDLSQYVVDLEDYLQNIKNVKVEYENIVNEKAHLNADIEIVGEIRENMDVKIDLRLNSLISNRIKKGLHQDNLDVHETGATKMSTRYAGMNQRLVDILKNNSDLQVFLDQTTLWEEIHNICGQLKKLDKDKNHIRRKIEKQSEHIKNVNESINTILEQLHNTDSKAVMENKISELQKQIDSLVIDPELDKKLDNAKKDLEKYQISKENLDGLKLNTAAAIKDLEYKIDELKEKLKNYSEVTEKNLQILSAYMIDGYELKTIADANEFSGKHRSEIRNHKFSDLSDKIGRIIRKNNENGIDPYALDTIFESRGHADVASAMRKQRSIDARDLRVVSFNINKAQKFINDDRKAVEKSLKQLDSGNKAAQITYTSAAAHQISDQYDLIDKYNEILAQGVRKSQGIQLKISLNPLNVDEQVISEARDDSLRERPALLKEVQKRLDRLANDIKVADDNEQFMEEAHKLLDIRQWSEFQIWIHRKQAESDNFELVDNKFVQSGGSGAEKAQAMVLPLLLVPKMILQRSKESDAPHMVMFDEFADKLDPETAKSFARTIDQFGFNFIATMPGGAQNKILADGVDNIAYDVISPSNKNDGKFHNNIVREAMIWQEAE